MSQTVELVQPASPDAWQAASELADEYVRSLGVSLDFQGWAFERAHLPSEYAAPDGAFLLTRRDGVFVGCGAVRRFAAHECEMKRLYVRPGVRGGGVGRAIAAALIETARELGYRRIRLDTLASMEPARKLYASLGFVETPPYRENPLAGARFLSRDL